MSKLDMELKISALDITKKNSIYLLADNYNEFGIIICNSPDKIVEIINNINKEDSEEYNIGHLLGLLRASKIRFNYYAKDEIPTILF